jgi:hypothetical protein
MKWKTRIKRGFRVVFKNPLGKGKVVKRKFEMTVSTDRPKFGKGGKVLYQG